MRTPRAFFCLSLVTALCAATLGIAPSANAAESQFVVDAAHSTVGFNIRHMVFSTVSGRFNSFVGEFSFDPETGKLGNSKFEVKADSIDTGNAKRDEHLRSADFFDVAKNPLITISNSKITKTGPNKYDWTCDLTMHGQTNKPDKKVVFKVEYLGTVKDPGGNMKAGFTAKTQILRSEWGLKWNKALEAGKLAVSDEVNIVVDIATVQKPAK